MKKTKSSIRKPAEIAKMGKQVAKAAYIKEMRSKRGK
jgi:hypothetical protein